MEGEDDPLSDACSPRIVVIGKRRYRTNAVAVAGAAVYSDEPDSGELLEGVEAVERGFRAKINVPAALYGKLIGRGGENKKRLQQDTQVFVYACHFRTRLHWQCSATLLTSIPGSAPPPPGNHHNATKGTPGQSCHQRKDSRRRRLVPNQDRVDGGCCSPVHADDSLHLVRVARVEPVPSPVAKAASHRKQMISVRRRFSRHLAWGRACTMGKPHSQPVGTVPPPSRRFKHSLSL